MKRNCGDIITGVMKRFEPSVLPNEALDGFGSARDPEKRIYLLFARFKPGLKSAFQSYEEDYFQTTVMK